MSLLSKLTIHNLQIKELGNFQDYIKLYLKKINIIK